MAAESVQSPTPASLTWVSSSRTDVGKVREVNEDACLDRPDAGMWVVADGMGGHSAGDIASQMIVETLGTLDASARLSEIVGSVEEQLIAVNTELRRIAAREETQTIGSTVVSLLARDRHAAVLWAGDSRAYRLRAGCLEQVSQDHALVEELVEKGLLSREQAATHPQGNLVTRAVGATDTLHVDIEIFELEPGDAFVLCSDGLDKEVGEAEIAAVLAEGEPSAASHALVELALSRGSRDNVTVVTVEIGGPDPDPDTDPDREVGPDDDSEGSEDTVPGLAGR